MLTTILMLALQAAAPAPMPERLAAPMPKGFKVGFETAQGGQTIEERVAASETVEAWTRMVTVQRLGGIAYVGAHGFLERVATRWAQACPDAVIGPIADATEDGRATASLRVDCPLNAQTGKPETMFARMLQGTTDLHMVQYAFRSVPTARETAAARAYLASVRLCPGSAAACR